MLLEHERSKDSTIAVLNCFHLIFILIKSKYCTLIQDFCENEHEFNSLLLINEWDCLC